MGFLDEADLDRSARPSPPTRWTMGKSSRTREDCWNRRFITSRAGCRATGSSQRDYERVLAPASVVARRLRAVRGPQGRSRGGRRGRRGRPRSPGARPAPSTRARRNLADRVEAHRFFQYVFLRQWLELKSYANERGIRIIGDMPIFVAYDSADVWAHPRQWKLDPTGGPRSWRASRPTRSAPPASSGAVRSTTGTASARKGSAGGSIGCARRSRLVDVVRLDHFRGFAACWEVPAADETAEHGSWVEVPGRDLFRAIADALGGATCRSSPRTSAPSRDDVHALRDELGFPGMRVLQFAWDGDPAQPPSAAPSTRRTSSPTRARTTTNTVVGWFAHRARPSAPPRPSASSARTACAISAPTAPRSTGISSGPSRCRSPTSPSCPLQDLLGARLDGPHEHAGARRGQLGVAVSRRRAHRRARPAPARDHRDLRPIA